MIIRRMYPQRGGSPIGGVRGLAAAAALFVMAGAADAAAQTVMFRNAEPGIKVEVVVNAATAGSGTVNTEGIASVAVNLAEHTGKTQIDALLFVDYCDALRIAVVVERGRIVPPKPGNCERRDIPGLFLVRNISTLVFDVGPANPTVLLRQGRFRIRPPRVWKPAATGFVLYGGGGLGKFRDTGFYACGTLEGCDSKEGGIGLQAGATFWLTRYAAADIGYLKPKNATASSTQTGYKFDSTFDAQVLTLGGKVGIPIGPTRIYGHGGWNRSQVLTTTNQTFESVKITVDGVERTIPGGTQKLEMLTEGWGWQFGGGFEAWLGQRGALYIEGGNVIIKGKPVPSGEGFVDDRYSYVTLGVRIKVF